MRANPCVLTMRGNPCALTGPRQAIRYSEINPMSQNSFGARSTLHVGGADYRYFRLAALEEKGVANVSRMPVAHRFLLENLPRHEDGRRVKAADIDAVSRGVSGPQASEIS